jgi:hypothetical protein
MDGIFCRIWPLPGTKPCFDPLAELFPCLTPEVGASGDDADVVQLGANILSTLVHFGSSAPEGLAPT